MICTMDDRAINLTLENGDRMLWRALRVFALLVVTAAVLLCGENPQKCWIYFRDKDSEAVQTLSKSRSPEQVAGSLGITARALARRAKVLPRGQLISAEDLPVSQSYVDRLAQLGISVINTSRWFNAVTANLTADERERASSLPFVERVDLVRTFRRRDPLQLQVPSLARVSSSSISQLRTIVHAARSDQSRGYS